MAAVSTEITRSWGSEDPCQECTHEASEWKPCLAAFPGPERISLSVPSIVPRMVEDHESCIL